MEPEVSTKDILNAIRGLEGRFDGLEGRFDGLEGRFDGLEKKMDALHEEAMDAIHMLSSSTDDRFDAVDRQIAGIRNEMVTKDYLDRKLADQEMETMTRVEKSFVRR
ncbi:MAG: hypothetical protein AAB473_02735 [Patescibacteria group bacterium]